MKRKIISLLLIAAMLIPLPTMAEESAQLADSDNKNTFTDVDVSHAAYEAVMYLAQQGIINGKSENTFAPEDSLKREEFAKILSNAFELSEANNVPIFNDVLAATWYAPYIGKVSATGLMQGIEKDKFGIGFTLSRQDLAVILKRFLDKEQVKYTAESTVLYADNSEIADYAKEAVAELSSCGVIAERENGLFKPRENATRAETAISVYNALMYRKKYADSLGLMGPTSQYDPPYDIPTDDRLAQSEPKVFDPNTWPRGEFLYEDFEDADYGILTKDAGFNETVSFESGSGYNGSTCLKINNVAGNTTFPRFKYVAKPGEIQTGDYLVLTAMIKTENLNGSGYCKGLLQVYDDKGNWITESSQPEIKATTATKDEWTEYTWVRMVKERQMNDLNPPKYFSFNVGAYMNNIKGTVYFDDMKVSVVRFHPMESVLMTPNYKGIIKGDDGIGDISLRAFINDANGYYNLDNFKFTAQITDDDHNVLLKSESDIITSSMDVYFSSKTLPMGGDYYLEVILTDETTGEQIQKDEWTLHKKEKDFTTVIDYDKYGRIIHNGEPKLPISVYTNAFAEPTVTDVIEGGFDNFLGQGMDGWYLYSRDEVRNAVNKLAENGLTVTMQMTNLTSGTNWKEVYSRCETFADKRGFLTKMVNNVKDLPYVGYYYIFDELNPVQYGFELSWFRKIVESLDLDHPTQCAIADPLDIRPGAFAKTSDFLGFDAYPVTGAADQDIGWAYDFMQRTQKLNPNRPYYGILQGFWYQSRGDLRAPNKEEFRNMAFQYLCGGSCMLDVYCIDYIKRLPSPGETWDQTWANYVDVLAEVQYLEPIILSTLPAPHYEVKGGEDWLVSMSKRHEGKSYLFAVNVGNKGKSAKIHLDGVKKIRGMYSKEVYEADEKGWFEIEMEKDATEVFEYEQADYKSSHAELKSFGLADVVIIDAEADIPAFIVNEDATEVEYNAVISDYAKVFINDVESEPSGKLDITNLSEITVNVVSEDGRFQTKKIYKLQRK